MPPAPWSLATQSWLEVPPTPPRARAEALGPDDGALSAKGLDSLISRGSVPCGGPNVRAADLE